MDLQYMNDLWDLWNLDTATPPSAAECEAYVTGATWAMFGTPDGFLW